jgi:HK97 family phage major capsid protein
MKITPKLKAWLVGEKLVAEEASDEVFLKAATDALTQGTLTAQLLVELQTEEAEKEAGAVVDLLRSISEGVKANAAEISSMKAAKEAPKVKEVAEVEEVAPPPPAKLKEGSPELPSDFKVAMGDTSEGNLSPGGDKTAAGLAIRVKGIQESFSTKRETMRFPAVTASGTKHPKAGQPVMEGERMISEPSELDKAIAGMWFKAQMLSSTGGRGLPHKLRMNQQDKSLLEYALHQEKWGGKIGSTDEENGIEIKASRLNDGMQKAVLDDLVSGGLEVAPIAFDDQIITFPLLFGELFPKINLVNITRGRRIEGASVATVTMAWGGGDDSAITLQLTAGFVTAFDTLIHVVDGAIEIGLDFMSDAAVDIGPIVTDGYGRRLLNQLDRVIATGSGAGEPEGVTVAAGTTAVASANGVGGPPTVGDYEGLLFGVPKEYKAGFAQNAVCFCANETTYARARGIPVGATDERRVFGMTHEDYQLLSRPYSIDGSMTNNDIFFGVMPRYRMYRRLGLTMRSSTEGTTLIRRNMLLITARARFGGQVEDGAAFAVMSDAQN